MSIDTPTNIHAAATIFATPDMGPPALSQVPAGDPPRLSELPAFNSLGCTVFDVRALGSGVPGAWLIKLDYPFAQSQGTVHVTEFAYFDPDGVPIGTIVDALVVIHIDDTFKLVVSYLLSSAMPSPTPLHVTFVDFDVTPSVQRMIAPPFPLPPPLSP
jgi:hypothetical protein